MGDESLTQKQRQSWANYCWNKSHNLYEYVANKMLEITGQQRRSGFDKDLICTQFQSVYILMRIADKISSCEPTHYEYFTYQWHEANDQFIALADMFLDTDS